jgi:hypothetical protein
MDMRPCCLIVARCQPGATCRRRRFPVVPCLPSIAARLPPRAARAYIAAVVRGVAGGTGVVATVRPAARRGITPDESGTL